MISVIPKRYSPACLHHRVEVVHHRAHRVQCRARHRPYMPSLVLGILHSTPTYLLTLLAGIALAALLVAVIPKHAKNSAASSPAMVCAVPAQLTPVTRPHKERRKGAHQRVS